MVSQPHYKLGHLHQQLLLSFCLHRQWDDVHILWNHKIWSFTLYVAALPGMYCLKISHPLKGTMVSSITVTAPGVLNLMKFCRLRLKCDGTCAETRFRLSAKQTSPFKLAGASVQSTTGSRGTRISGSNAGYTMFRGSVKGTGCPLRSPVSPSLPLPCVTVCHHVSTGLYQ